MPEVRADQARPSPPQDSHRRPARWRPHLLSQASTARTSPLHRSRRRLREASEFDIPDLVQGEAVTPHTRRAGSSVGRISQTRRPQAPSSLVSVPVNDGGATHNRRWRPRLFSSGLRFLKFAVRPVSVYDRPAKASLQQNPASEPVKVPANAPRHHWQSDATTRPPEAGESFVAA